MQFLLSDLHEALQTDDMHESCGRTEGSLQHYTDDEPLSLPDEVFSCIQISYMFELS